MTENKRFTRSNTYGWNGTAFLKVMNGLDEKNKKLNERIKQQDENRHMSEVLDENNQLKQQLHDFVQLANENDKTLNELYQYMESYFDSRHENVYWSPKSIRG